VEASESDPGDDRKLMPVEVILQDWSLAASLAVHTDAHVLGLQHIDPRGARKLRTQIMISGAPYRAIAS
jgi:hypothetical protein